MTKRVIPYIIADSLKMDQAYESDNWDSNVSTSNIDCTTSLYIGERNETLVVALPKWFLNCKMVIGTTKGKFSVEINKDKGTTEFKQWKPFRKPDLETLRMASIWRNRPNNSQETQEELDKFHQRIMSPTVYCPSPVILTPECSKHTKECHRRRPGQQKKKKTVGLATKPGRSPTSTGTRRGRFLTRIPIRTTPLAELEKKLQEEVEVKKEQDDPQPIQPTLHQPNIPPPRMIPNWLREDKWPWHQAKLEKERRRHLERQKKKKEEEEEAIRREIPITPPPSEPHVTHHNPPSSPTYERVIPKREPKPKEEDYTTTTMRDIRTPWSLRNTAQRPAYLAIEPITPPTQQPKAHTKDQDELWDMLKNSEWAEEVLATNKAQGVDIAGNMDFIENQPDRMMMMTTKNTIKNPPYTRKLASTTQNRIQANRIGALREPWRSVSAQEAEQRYRGTFMTTNQETKIPGLDDVKEEHKNIPPQEEINLRPQTQKQNRSMKKFTNNEDQPPAYFRYENEVNPPSVKRPHSHITSDESKRQVKRVK